MNDIPPTLNTGLKKYKNSMNDLNRKDTKKKINNDDKKMKFNKSKGLLSKADLNVQNVLTTILKNYDDEDKYNLNIHGTLEQIQKVKQNINNFRSSSSDDSDISDKNYKLSVIDETNNNLSNSLITKSEQVKGLMEKIQISKKNQNMPVKKISLFNSIENSNCGCNENERHASTNNYKINQGQRNKAFEYNKKQEYIPEDYSSEEIKDMNHIIPMNYDSIKNLNKLKDELQESLSLSPSRRIETKLLNNLVKGGDFAEDIEESNEYQLTSSADSSIYYSEIPGETRNRFLFRRTNPIYDSLSEEEYLDESYYYLEPYSKFRFIFDAFLAILSFISFFHLPFSIAFIHNSSQNVIFFNILINGVLDMMNFIDIIISFHTAYYDLEEYFITSNYFICLHYLKSWFIIDFISFLPSNTILDCILIFGANSRLTVSTFSLYSNDNIALIHLFRLLRLLKSFKIIFNNFFLNYLKDNFLDSFIESKWAILYISFLLFFSSVNLFGCIFIFLGYNNYPNWFEAQSIEPDDQGGVYIASIYFILMTIVSIGYGDIVAKNMVERVFNVFLLIFGIMIYSWAISALSNQMEDSNPKSIEYNSKVKLLEQIRLSHQKFPSQLNEKILRYLNHNFEHEQCNVEVILDQLPSLFRKQLIYNMYKPILNNFYFFKNFSNDNFSIRVLMAFIPTVYLRNERLIHDGDILEEMFFVKGGTLTLELLIPSVLNEEIDRTISITRAYSSTINTYEFDTNRRLGTSWKTKITSIFPNQTFRKDKKPTQFLTGYEDKYVRLIDIRKNEHFGDIIMFLNQRCPLSVRVKTKKAEVFLLKKTDAIDISMQFPKIWRKIIRKSIFNFEQINRLIRRILRFFFIQNKTCLNQLEKKHNYLKINSKHTGQLGGSFGNRIDNFNNNIELASIPSMITENTEEYKNTKISRNDLKITAMMNAEDDNNQIKMSESSTANLISNGNIRESNKKELSSIKPIVPQISNTKISNNLNISEFQGKKSSKGVIFQSDKSSEDNCNSEAKSIKSFKYMTGKLDESYGYDSSFMNSNDHRNIEIINEKVDSRGVKSLRSYNSNEVNNELCEGESIYNSYKYMNNDINCDGVYHPNTFIKNIFKQKPEDTTLSLLNLTRSGFKTLQKDKTDDFEYNSSPASNTFINENAVKRKVPGPLAIKDFKIAINVISTATQEENSDRPVNQSDDKTNNNNVLKFNKTMNFEEYQKNILQIGDATKKRDCLSSRSMLSKKSKKSNRSQRSQRSQRSNRSNRSNRSIKSNRSMKSNQGLEIILSSKNDTVDIFNMKSKKLTSKEPQKIITNSRFRSNSSLLQVIGENIHKNSMNLNNPASFYSNTFANMLNMQNTKNNLIQINKRLDNLISLLENN